MIQPNELRLGNIVLFDNKQDEIFMIGNKMVSGNKHSHFYYERLHPIPLTPEVLTGWCGFTRVDHINGYSFHTLSKSKQRIHLDIYNTKTTWMGYSIKHCEHLHTLQNLIYFLCGEELIVNLPK